MTSRAERRRRTRAVIRKRKTRQETMGKTAWCGWSGKRSSPGMLKKENPPPVYKSDWEIRRFKERKDNEAKREEREQREEQNP